ERCGGIGEEEAGALDHRFRGKRCAYLVDRHDKPSCSGGHQAARSGPPSYCSRFVATIMRGPEGGRRDSGHSFSLDRQAPHKADARVGSLSIHRRVNAAIFAPASPTVILITDWFAGRPPSSSWGQGAGRYTFAKATGRSHAGP